jgi:phage terminase large subunit-like protein
MTPQALQKVIDGTPAERKYLCEQSFGLFAIYYFSEYFKYPLAPYHYDMVQDCHDLLDGKIREVVWLMYRESAKTTFAKLFVLYLICTNKRRYINVDSFDKENSERILFDVAFELSNNNRLRADFGALFVRSKNLEDVKQNRLGNFVTENGIRVEAHSTQESMRGRLHLNQRPDALILDDFETNKTKDSQAYTRQVQNHISEALAGMSPDAFVMYLCNYITEYGNVQFLLNRAKNDVRLRVRNVPVMVDRKISWEAKYALTDDEAKETGKVSIEDKQRQLGSQVFSYEMMNLPIDESMAEFKRDWIRRADESVLNNQNTNCFITIDTAVSKKDSADFTGVTINRITMDNTWYVKTYRAKFNPTELIDHLFYLHSTYKPTILGIEKTVYLMAIRPFLESEMRKRGVFFSIKELEHKGVQKETRIRSLIPRLENKAMVFIGDSTAIEEEMRVFPRGVHDDILDSLAYQNQVAYKPFINSNNERDLMHLLGTRTHQVINTSYE